MRDTNIDEADRQIVKRKKKAKPTLFTDANVLAIEQGRKWQTRRTVKPPVGCERFEIHRRDENYNIIGLDGDDFRVYRSDGTEAVSFAPYRVGDRLYVKHAWRTIDPKWDSFKPTEIPEGTALEYRCDGVPRNGRHWRSPLFMREWMARLVLEVTTVRCERLQDISGADAKAEGWGGYLHSATPDAVGNGPRTWFRKLWESINGLGSWERNDWVWVYEFRVTK